MSIKPLMDAACQIKQAQAVLSMWLENTTKDPDPDLPRLIGSIITMLNGVPEAMEETERKLGEYVMRDYREDNA